MYCRFCGKAIREGEAFCRHCGERQPKESYYDDRRITYRQPKSKAPWVIFFLIVIVIGVFAYIFLPRFLKSDEEQAKEIVETFFDSLKNGYTSGAMECVNPGTKEQYEGALGAGDLILKTLGLPETSSLVNPALGLINQNYYKDYEFKVREVTLDKEKKNGSAKVEVYIGGKSKGTTTIDVMKYNGKWYVK